MAEVDLLLNKVNETYYHIQCDKGIAKELNEYFSFFVPGYKFMPKFKNKMWDGKIKLFNLYNRMIYTGLLNNVEQFCKSRQYTFHNNDPIYSNPISMKETIDFTEKVNGLYVPKEHQFKALVHILRNQRTLLLSPTSSGKSYTIYLLIRYLMDELKLKKGLLIVPTTGLVQQMFNDFDEYSTKNGWKVEDNVHFIYQGQSKNKDTRLYLSTWQSIYNMPEQYFNQFDYVINDEVHHAKANSIKKIIENCTNASWRVGFTGTLDDSETHAMVLTGLFGDVKKITSTKQLMEKKEIANLTIKSIILKHNDEESKYISKMNYHDYYKSIVSNEKRNKFIMNLVASLEGNGLILYQFVDKHGKILYNKMISKYPEMDIRFISGKVLGDDRETIRQEMIAGDNIKLFASYGTFSTGINIPNLKWIVSTTPGKSKIRILQSIGRSLRLHSDKNEAVFFDIADDTSWKSKKDFGLIHLEQRMEMYMAEKFKIKQYKVKL